MKKLTLFTSLTIAGAWFLVAHASDANIRKVASDKMTSVETTPVANTSRLTNSGSRNTAFRTVSQTANVRNGQSQSLANDYAMQLPSVVRPSMFVQLPSLTPGVIESVNVREGQSVKKGTLLVQLDDRVARARVTAATVRSQLTGALERAKVDQRLAQQRLERKQRVANAGAAYSYETMEAQGEFDQATAMIRQQQDQLDAADSERLLAEAQLNDLKIIAPFDGVVTRIHQKAGAIDPSVVVLEFANLSVLEVELNVPSTRYGNLQPGQSVNMIADVPISSIVQGQVLSVSPIIDSASDTFRCLVQINNQNGRLPAGFRVKLQ